MTLNNVRERLMLLLPPKFRSKRKENRMKIVEITLQEAQERIAKEQKDVEGAFHRYGYTYYSSFTEEPDIKFWVKEGKYELKGRYSVPAPCISIDSTFFWQYEDENGDVNEKNSGTGADELLEFLTDNQ